jgi:hypothetical protein
LSPAYRAPSTAATIAVVLAAMLVAACGGGGKTAAPTEAPTIAAPSSGVEEVDRIVQAVLRGDAVKLAELTGYSHVPCASQPPSPPKVGDPPKCEADQADGTVVEALPVTGCEGGWAQPADAVPSYQDAIAGRLATLSAVYVPAAPASPFEAGLQQQYVAVIQIDAEDGSAKNVALHISGGRVTWLETACPPGADLAAPGRAQSFLVTPTVAPLPGLTAEPSSTP